MSAMAGAVIDDPPRGRAVSGSADGRRKCLVAGRVYEAGEPIFVLDNLIWCPAAEGTVEHPSGRHFRDLLLDGVVQSSDPNCRLSFELMALIARKDIQPGEVITTDIRGRLARRR